jgi:hypothetical protein
VKPTALAVAINAALFGYPLTMARYGYDATMRAFDLAAG